MGFLWVLTVHLWTARHCRRCGLRDSRLLGILENVSSSQRNHGTGLLKHIYKPRNGQMKVYIEPCLKPSWGNPTVLNSRTQCTDYIHTSHGSVMGIYLWLIDSSPQVLDIYFFIFRGKGWCAWKNVGNQMLLYFKISQNDRCLNTHQIIKMWTLYCSNMISWKSQGHPPQLRPDFQGGGWLGGVPQTEASEANSKTLSSGCHVGVSRLTRGEGKFWSECGIHWWDPVSTRWWQLKYFSIFDPEIWGRFPICLISFRWVETTNQSIFARMKKKRSIELIKSRLNCNSTWAQIPGGGVADLHFLGKWSGLTDMFEMGASTTTYSPRN